MRHPEISARVFHTPLLGGPRESGVFCEGGSVPVFWAGSVSRSRASLRRRLQKSYHT